MKWDHYEIFCRVAELGNFSAAAKTLKRPKSSVSNAVAHLEAELNVRLLERTTRRVRLTEAGDSLYCNIKPLFAQLQEARNEAINLSRIVAGTLRIAAPYEFSAHHLAGVACDIMAQHPQLHIQIDTEYAPVNPLEERYDIVFSMVDTQMPSSTVVARRVFSLPQGLFASPRLFHDQAPPDRPQLLSGFPIIASTADVEWGFREAGEAQRSIRLAAPRLVSANADVRLQAAIAGLGISRITRSYCQKALSEGLLVEVLANYSWAPIAVYALISTRRLLPSKVRVFLDALNDYAAGISVKPAE